MFLLCKNTAGMGWVCVRAESRDYTAWSRDDWLRLLNSASDQPPYDVTDRYSL